MIPVFVAPGNNPNETTLQASAENWTRIMRAMSPTRSDADTLRTRLAEAEGPEGARRVSLPTDLAALIVETAAAVPDAAPSADHGQRRADHGLVNDEPATPTITYVAGVEQR